MTGAADAASAIWRRLDHPGHDAARLARNGAGWRLRGTAAFRHADGPACVTYAVDLDADWSTRSGTVTGFVAHRPIDAAIERVAGEWALDGRTMAGMGHLRHLDYAFTPATNLQQLRAMALGRGEARDLPVAWFDLDTGRLTELPQRYERIGDARYHYRAPTVPYEAVLEVGSDLFVAVYPGLWVREDSGSGRMGSSG